MLVNRRTFVVNKPYLEEALGLLVELGQLTKRVAPDAVVRVYASEYGPFDTIACEVETENLTTVEQLFTRLNTDPQVAGRFGELFRRWQEITAPGGTNELWRLVE